VSIVREFIEAFEVEHAEYPSRPSDAQLRLAMRLITEEYKEVHAEFQTLLSSRDPSTSQATLGLLLKELADLRYVVEHCALVCGMDIEGAYAEVHRSNMSKLGEDGRPVRREDGKVLKGPNYSPADMTKFVHPIIDIVPEEV
jgi:predicted HAD superfamily Cof-like phosphohydrolase